MTGNVCVYCPGGPDSDFEYSTQSYTGYEPTSMRAIRARYNPYLQTRNRVDQLKRLGHSVDKVSLHSFVTWISRYISSASLSFTSICISMESTVMKDVQVEFIIMGGTFMSLPVEYRDYFIRNLHDALSGHNSNNVEESVR